MANLPAFYADNVRLIKNRTITIRGNVATNIVGGTAKGFEIKNCENLRAKNNRAHKIRSMAGTTVGFDFDRIKNLVMVYNTCSRAQIGFNFDTITSLDCYNVTAHLCNRAVMSNSSGTFRNIAISTYQGYDLYKKATGFYVSAGTIDLDYCMYYGLAGLVEAGAVTEGDNITEEKPLYLDEVNDAFTPDYISPQVNAGTENPLRVTSPDISGIESKVTNETTANRAYWYELLDNSFWDIENDQAAEVSFTKAVQSRIFASSEVATSQVKRDVYIKAAESVQRFAEAFPAYIRYEKPSEYNKRVADLWFGTQNVATVQAYQNGIGGYNLLPSFFKHMQDYENGWIVDVSYVSHDNWLNSMSDLRYGIGIDVLGVSTLNQATSGECYTNIMSCIADIAPVRWCLHEQVQPSGYVVFTDMWNGFENCTLTNMLYNDDFGISIDDVDVNNGTGRILTPLISTENIMTSAVAASGQDVEVSLLDRRWSEIIERDFYWRQGTNSADMSDWEQITDPVGGILSVTSPYVQFKIDVSNVLRFIDYEFRGIALRGYSTARSWTKTQPVMERALVQFMPGEAVFFAGAGPEGRGLSIAYPKDLLIPRTASIHSYIPLAMRDGSQKTIRLLFSSDGPGNGVARMSAIVYLVTDTGAFFLSVIDSFNLTLTGSPVLVSYDLSVPGLSNLDTELVVLFIQRDSNDPTDTFPSGVSYIHGRVL